MGWAKGKRRRKGGAYTEGGRGGRKEIYNCRSQREMVSQRGRLTTGVGVREGGGWGHDDDFTLQEGWVEGWRLKVEDGINIKIASFWQLKKTITNNWTVWFAGWTVGSTDSISIQPLFGSIDHIGLELWPSNGQIDPIRFLKPWLFVYH